MRRTRPVRPLRDAPLRRPAHGVVWAAVVALLVAPGAAAQAVTGTTVEALTRCVAGEVVQVVRVGNPTGDAVTVDVSSTYGDRSVALAAGASTSVLLSTRRAFVPAGEVTATTTSAGAATGTVAAGFAERSCADGARPRVEATPSPAVPDGRAGWWTSPVTVVLSLVEGTGAVVEHRLDDGSWVGHDGGAVIPVTVTEDGRHTLDHRATVDGVPVAGSGGRLDVPLDTTPPEVVWDAGVPDGAELVAGSLPPAPGCTALDATSGPASCEVTGWSTQVGRHTLTATAADVAGHVTTDTRTYTVVEPWVVGDFWRPVVADALNPVAPGHTVLLQFDVRRGGTPVGDLAAVTSVSVVPVSCTDPGAALGEATELGTDGLRHRNGRYLYPWRTDATGTGCVALTVTAQQGASTTAWFRYGPG